MAKGQLGYKVRTITCAGCGATVTGHYRPRQRFCTPACYHTAPRPERRNGAERPCEQCGTVFYAPRTRGDARFCTLACQIAWQGRGKTEHACSMCGSAFRWSPSRSASGRYNITYCSLACRDADPERVAMLLRMNAIQQTRRTTSAERIGYALLDALGVPYEPQAIFAGKFCVDALLAEHRVVVQFDGDYWHDRGGGSTEPRIMRRAALDRSQDAYMRACGWEVVRLWESDLKRDLAGCAEKVRQHLRPPS